MRKRAVFIKDFEQSLPLSSFLNDDTLLGKIHFGTKTLNLNLTESLPFTFHPHNITDKE